MSSPPRIPPLSERLEFARNTGTRCVHILPWQMEGFETALPGPVTVAQSLNFLPGRCPMLCGEKLTLGPDAGWPAIRVPGDSFADEELCFKCVRALGGQQWRAFHADNRGGDD